MNKNLLVEIINQTISDLSKLSPFFEKNQQNISKDFLTIFTHHYKLIEYIKSDNSEIIEMRKIKKDKKTHLQKYITAFETHLKYQQIIKEQNSCSNTIADILIFKLYMTSLEDFNKLQSEVYTFLFSSPEIATNIKVLKKRYSKSKRIPKEIDLYIQRYELFKYLYKAFKFFRCYSITEKNIMTSLSIVLYKNIIKTNTIKKYPLKEILESMFFNLDYPTTIRIDNINNTYVKTKVDELLIYAYPSSKEKVPLYDIDRIISVLNKKIKKYENNSHKVKRFEHHLNTKISHIQKLVEF